MSTTNNSSMTLVAIQAALQAGEILKRGFGTLYQITAKPGKQNIVTEYDHAAEACIVRLIKQHFPSHSILAEEMGHFKAQDQTIVWYIDPLDGTTNFAKHIPIFTISIAAYQEQKGLCAVIWQPLTQELFIAERGKGAYLNGTPLSISSTQKIADAIIGVGSPYPLEDSHELIDYIPLFNHLGITFRNLGSAALNLAYVAAGKLDGFFLNSLQPWDIAAGKLLVEEAGGKVSNYQGNSIDITSPSSLIAANPSIYSQIFQVIQPNV